MPAFPGDLRTLADSALARIVSDEAGPASNWVGQEDWKQWRAGLSRLRAVFAPSSPSILLFDAG
ncbi:hypothetical protein [Streptomyces sp. NPDC088180]|uniref:hypothetical protein n=1 Tax=Streptomyces sp. NPDC088180 TaxID=3365837 RepID=UPI0038057C00